MIPGAEKSDATPVAVSMCGNGLGLITGAGIATNEADVGRTICSKFLLIIHTGAKPNFLSKNSLEFETLKM